MLWLLAAVSWLPTTPPARPTIRDLDGAMRPLVCRYVGSRLAARIEIGREKADVDGALWACSITNHRHGDTEDLSVTFRVVHGRALSAGVAVAFDFAHWSRANNVLVPGVVYDGNRFRALGGGYMPVYPPDMFFNPRTPLTISNDPRLSPESGVASKIELLTGNASTPAMGFYAPHRHRGFVLLAEQGSRFGNNGLFVEENARQDRCSFVVSAPGVRERAAQFGGFAPSGDAGVDWSTGDRLTLRFRIYSFHAAGIDALYRRLLAVRKSLTGQNHPRNLVPFSELADRMVSRLRARWLETPAGGYYAPENSRDFQLGWVSGNMQTPLLARKDPADRARICRQLDFVTSRLQGPSGFFFGGITAEGRLRADRTFNGRLLALTRKNGDALFDLVQFFEILRAQGHGRLIRPGWRRAAWRCADAFCRAWEQRHQFGQYLDPMTGEVAVFNSSGGAIASAALALAAKWFHEPRFLHVAKASAELVYRRDVLGHGFTGGACGDTSQDPDSETSFGFLEGLMALYWATGRSEWLDRARTQAALAATWVLSYDERFPAASDIGRLRCHMAGAVFASAQNKHAAPGICTSSGDYLFKLFRATGDSRYAELIRDIQHAQAEATDMPGHRTCGAGAGASMERIQPTDAEGKGAIGNFIHTQNAWCELDGLMMVTQLPGIYVQLDRSNTFVFDHVEARVIRRSDGSVLIQIHNPTPYPAHVSVFAETADQAKRPLGYTAYLNWPRVTVAAGGSRRFLIRRTGR